MSCYSFSKLIVFGVFAATSLSSCPKELSAETDSPSEETPVDLDSLEEEAVNLEQAVNLDDLEDDQVQGSPEKGKALDYDSDPVLPFEVVDTEVQRKGHFILFALLVLVPVAGMLFPPKSNACQKEGESLDCNRNNKKET